MVPTTVGTSNRHLGSAAVAMIAYDAGAVRDRLRPVRCSPYLRNLVTRLEQFGHEEDWTFADECEIRIHTGSDSVA